MPSNEYEVKFLLALAITIIVESGVVIFLLRSSILSRTNKKVAWPVCFAAGIIPSFATLPYLWFVFPAFIPTYLLQSLIGEGAIFITEILILRFLTGCSWKKCALISGVANSASIIVGLVIFY